jgi:hypothetical protein
VHAKVASNRQKTCNFPLLHPQPPIPEPGNTPNGSGLVAMKEIFGRLVFLEVQGFQALIDSSMATMVGKFFLLLLLNSCTASLNYHQGSLLSVRASEATARGKKWQNSLKK